MQKKRQKNVCMSNCVRKSKFAGKHSELKTIIIMLINWLLGLKFCRRTVIFQTVNSVKILKVYTMRLNRYIIY